MNTTATILKADGGEWIQHDGKGMPVEPDAMVQVRWRSVPETATREVAADYFRIFWKGDDIAFYRVHEPSKAIKAAEGEQ